jgi:hypothetical protein
MKVGMYLRRRISVERVVLFFLFLSVGSSVRASSAPPAPAFRPPAVPLLVNNPYFSVWSMASKLTDDTTRHWTRHKHALVSLIRIDGKTYRLMGIDPANVPPFPQLRVQVLPTRSIYTFGNASVHVVLTFMTADLMTDLDVMSRPVSYITWQVFSMDGHAHKVSIYDSTSSQLAVNTPDQFVQWQQETAGPLNIARIGSQDQFYLHTQGDDVRIDWGFDYMAAEKKLSSRVIGANESLLKWFVETGKLPARSDPMVPRATTDRQPVLAFVFDLGKVNRTPVSRHVMVASDEVWSILYFGNRLRPYWRRNGATAESMLQQSETDYPKLVKRCAALDTALMTDMEKVGGKQYAQLGALAYRQALGATGLVADANGKPLMITKEDTSNGDASTVDVIFPMSPELLFFSPTLMKATLAPILTYASSSHWKFDNAPHDLEKYPILVGTDNGGEAMPVEESGNMLLLSDAIAHEEGNTEFVNRWWPTLTKWAIYLKRYGNDPEDQLCTDDFTGRLAHNANLAVKAILALAAYGDLARMRGDDATARTYTALAHQYAEHWMMADNDGSHYRLAFDKPGTWSQKYNLVWDQVLDLHIFPPSVAEKELAYYRTKYQAYGLPLDSRGHVTEVPWSTWVATMASDPAQFREIVGLIYKYSDLSTRRVPFADVYQANSLDESSLYARPVVGSVFMKMLADPALWKKWSALDQQKISGWADIPATPPKPRLLQVIATSQSQPQLWRYTTKQPPNDWTSHSFSDSSWKQGNAMFGSNLPNVQTKWNSDDIWMRRTVTIPNGKYPRLALHIYHDGDTEIYIEGQLAARELGDHREYDTRPIPMRILPLLKPGSTITIAVHQHKITGDQGVDAGIVDIAP